MGNSKYYNYLLTVSLLLNFFYLKAQSHSFKYQSIEITPIEHATLKIDYKNHSLLIDPVDSIKVKEIRPTFVLVTDIHGDHFNLDVLKSIHSNYTLIAPIAVVNQLEDFKPELIVLNNEETFSNDGIHIEAIPMYNLREDALKFHTKGRGNGYVISFDQTRVYISGDTEDIPEMRALKNIDVALICMNLPYTMDVDHAADAVLAFNPHYVIPYHYRGRPDYSDIDRFKNQIIDPMIEVIQLNWYPNP